MSRTSTRRSSADHLHALEGEWAFESLRLDGNDMPGAMIGGSKLLMNGDRFRMESPEATYDGRFTIDTSVTPMQIDITFVEGPEAGNVSHGIFELADDDRLTICLGLVGSSRPRAFESAAGTGHALEHLRRVSTAASAKVIGGAGVAAGKGEEPTGAAVGADDFDGSPSPMLQQLEGPWLPVRLVMNAEEMRADWLSFGLRTQTGNETKVVFGGQTMLHAKTRIDDTVSPVAIDYLHLHGASKGKVSLGILEWVGDEVRILMASPGKPRPANFNAAGAGLTLSQWKRRT